MSKPSQVGKAAILISTQNREINRLKRVLRETRHELRSTKARLNDYVHIMALTRADSSTEQQP